MKLLPLILLFAFSLPAGAQEPSVPSGSAVGSSSPWSLRQCIDHAISHNLQVKQRESQQRQQETALHDARMQRLPDLSGGISEQFSFGRSLTIDNTYANYNTSNTSFSLGTSVPLFTGLRLPNQVALARLNLAAAVEDLNAVKDNIAIQVAQSYMQVLFCKELLAVAQNQTALSRAQHERKQAYLEVEKANASEVAEAASIVAQNELTEVQAANDLQLALLDLSQLLELDSVETLSITALPAESTERLLPRPESIYQLALQQKPQIKAAELRIQGATKSIKIAQSQFYPQLHFNAGLGTGYYNSSGRPGDGFGAQMRDNFSKYLGISLSVPLFNRFGTINQVKQTKEQRLSQQLALDETRKQLYKEIQQAYYSAVAAQKKLDGSRVALAATESAFQTVRARYEQGKATATDYAEQNAAVLKAASNLLQSKYDCLFRYKILDFYAGNPIE